MVERIAIPRLVLGGVSSGVGKTTLTVALIAALRRRGLDVAPFKCGPDYLDPGYHELAAGRRSWNLDGWMMGHDAVLGTFGRAAGDADLALVEGVMGLFDGASPTGPEGSTAEIASWLSAPVILAADAGGMARSFAALCRGYADFDDETFVAGAIANRLGSKGHLDLLRRACASDRRGLALMGGFPKDPEIAMPERHLGLVTADPSRLDASRLGRLADIADEWIDLDGLIELARSAPPLPAPSVPRARGEDRRCRIGVARDEAFQFYYEENLHLLEAAGAKLVPFSPMADTRLPEVDGLYLGGGYPELHAEALAANASLRSDVLAFSRAGRPIYAECGGMMYLQRAITTLDGVRHRMVGAFDGVATMRPRRVALGYVEVELTRPSLLGNAGIRFRGHQFRYSDVKGCSSPSVYRVRGRRGREATAQGYAVDRTIGSYGHGHWASHPQVADHLVAACAAEARA